MKEEAVRIIKTLQANGYVAYFAGGCVRDILMRKKPNDIDIATSAKPEEVEKLFNDTHQVGKKFGTIIVRSGDYQYEVTTFRKEGRYNDGRRPSSVVFTDAKEDAKRRDFTINGVFYNPANNTFIDYVGGRDDIKKRVIDFIGDPTERINEDRLRLIRAIRFKITLGFQYANETFDAVRKNASKIKDISPERVRDELNRIIQNENRHIGLIELSQSKILNYILPEVEKLKGVPQPAIYHHEGDCFTHTYLALKSLPKDASIRLCWAVLLHDIAKPITLEKKNGLLTFNEHAQKGSEMAKKILERLKFSKVEINEISWLIHYHMSVSQIDDMRPSKQLEFLTDPRFNDLIELVEADSRGTYPVNLDLVEKMEAAKKKAIFQIQQKGRIKEVGRLIDGNDLINLNVTPKKNYGEILDQIYDKQIAGELKDKSQAIEFVKDNYL